jgi:hypothetical protein
VREVVLVLDDAAGEPVGEQVPESAVSPVELLGVAAVQELHPAREGVAAGVEDEVVVRRHQAERVHLPPEAIDAAAEVRQEVAAVGRVEEDVAAGGSARVDVEVAVGERRAENAGHVSDESGRSAPERSVWIDRRTLVAVTTSAADVSRV